MNKKLIIKTINVLLNNSKEDFSYLSISEWRRYLISLSNNRVLYSFAKNCLKGCVISEVQISDLTVILKEGEERMVKFQETLSLLKTSFNRDKVPYLIVKTNKLIDYVTYDIDVLVPYDSFDSAIKSLRSAGCRILPHPRKQGLHQRNCNKEGLLNIDLHRKFYWLGVEHIDYEYVWGNTKNFRVNGVECTCPSLEVDYLLHNKQLVFERYYVTLLDYLAITLFIKRGLDKNKIEEQVAKFGWGNSYAELDQTFDYISKCLNYSENTCNNLEFPYIFKYSFVIKQFFEIFKKHKRLVLFDLIYYHFTFLRYFLLGKFEMPYYKHWFDFSKLK